ncbi:dTDP-4-dehydrorhamnose reductase [Leptobacterium flavescens]|uniref:dTDP-4-dehydrorhamnose reductase n=1 Tax=Leptobacterium flavescens TaxID=472055 RepID=A0A6P0UN01_9FLAO|nr:dTDP-4-dehydrorhamnose reductase [Leptobacterium flavescens]NER13258.1 dTDP-4-dehydrorhamnose reductase [Leptobacterium flavescens]
MKSVIITGANGQLGLALKQISDSYEFRFKFVSKESLNITDKDQLEKFFFENRFDYCINCAAYTNVEQAEKEPEKTFKVNSDGVKNLAEVCKKRGIALIHISTDYVFDGKKRGPYTEEDTPNPINEYGKSKFQGEQHIQEILEEYYLIRTSWLYSDFGKNFYKTILEKAGTNETLRITDDQTGCPTHALNLAHFILTILNKKDIEFGIYHYTDGEAMTWFDFAYKILKENGMLDKVKLERVKNYRTFAARPKNSELASNKPIKSNEN